LIVSLWISFTAITSVFPNSAYARIIGNRTQQWISPQQNVKIEFTYEPEKPLLDSPTELKYIQLLLPSVEINTVATANVAMIKLFLFNMSDAKADKSSSIKSNILYLFQKYQSINTII
jgi:hypothetical protein